MKNLGTLTTYHETAGMHDTLATAVNSLYKDFYKIPRIFTGTLVKTI